MRVAYPLCLDCAYFDWENEKNGHSICKAYSDGIPDSVIEEKSKPDYDENTPCPNGYKFERK